MSLTEKAPLTTIFKMTSSGPIVTLLELLYPNQPSKSNLFANFFNTQINCFLGLRLIIIAQAPVKTLIDKDPAGFVEDERNLAADRTFEIIPYRN
ncbi:MAG: hypothetical protein KKF98_09310 [Bacteroidetes bacterium]|nr:hypothetical protein [Bacteroidota bacterium]